MNVLVFWRLSRNPKVESRGTGHFDHRHVAHPAGLRSTYATLFFIFSDRRPRSGLGFGNLARAVSQKWKQMTTEDKAHYYELQKQDKHRYDREMKEYKAQMRA